MNRKPLVAGNWKMHGTLESVDKLVSELNQIDISALTCDILVCPPTLFIDHVIRSLKQKQINVGAQNISEYSQGAFTGEVSGDMLKSIGSCFAIVGHSERRSLFQETNEQVAKKAISALEYSVTPIVCVGETLEQRESNDTWHVIEKQLNAVVEVAGTATLSRMVIAYEPVWAIGTGKTASPEQAQDVHHQIRCWLRAQSEDAANKVRILYGGSVKASNATELFSQRDIDGGLIGGASLNAEEFMKICKSAG